MERQKLIPGKAVAVNPPERVTVNNAVLELVRYKILSDRRPGVMVYVSRNGAGPVWYTEEIFYTYMGLFPTQAFPMLNQYALYTFGSE